MKRNPFLVRGYEPDLFCDRHAETRQLIDNALNGVDTTLVSPRKYGKTGLIFNAFETVRREKIEMETIYVDLFSTQSLEDFIKILADTLVRFPEKTSFGQRIMSFLRSLRPVFSFDSLTGDPQVSFTYQVEQEKEKTLQNILEFLNSQPVPILIAFDEFQQISDYPERMEALLRTLIQNLHNLHFIFSGNRQALMTEMFLSPKRPLFSQTHLLSIDKIDETIYSNFIRQQFRSGDKEIDDDALEFILQWTHCHTFYTQSLCNATFAIAPERVTLSVVRNACVLLLERQQSAYMQYRDLLTPVQWQMLVGIAKEECVTQVTSGAFLKKYNISGATTAKRTMQSLVDKELVLALPQKKQTQYQVYDVFFSRWLAREF